MIVLELFFSLLHNCCQFWDARSPNPVGELVMPDRVYDLDVRGSLMVVATANRQVVIYDVSGAQPHEHSRKESPLKYNTRCVSCFPDQTGFAIGSIEGRVGIQYVQKVGNKDHFAFKCHRNENNVYSVNGIAFQQQFGTFATVGSDGVVTFWDKVGETTEEFWTISSSVQWDVNFFSALLIYVYCFLFPKDNKQRLKAFNPIQQTIPCAAFNAHGNLFAYASSYDWSKGSSFYAPGTPNEIYIHPTAEDEIKPKNSRKK
jgi:mRNA export factor